MNRKIAVGFGIAAVLLGTVSLPPGSPVVAGTEEGETLVTTTGDPKSGLSITVTAAPDEVNNVVGVWVWRESDETAWFRFRDGAAGIGEMSAHCTMPVATVVRCDANNVVSLVIATSDRADRVRLEFKPADVVIVTIAQIIVRAGRGDDDVSCPTLMVPITPIDIDLLEVALGRGPDSATIACDVGPTGGTGHIIVDGGDGNDKVNLDDPGRARGRAGDDNLIGGEGNQRLSGGPGMDLLVGGPGAHDLCDGGADLDSGGAGCEETLRIP